MKRLTVATAVCLFAVVLHAEEQKGTSKKPVLGRHTPAATTKAPATAAKPAPVPTGPPKPSVNFAGRGLADCDASTKALVERAVTSLGGSDVLYHLRSVQRLGSRMQKANAEDVKAQERKRNRAIASGPEEKKVGDRTYDAETIIQFPDLFSRRLQHPDLNMRVVINSDAAFMYHSEIEVSGVALKFHQDDREDIQRFYNLLPLVALRRRTTGTYRFHNAGPAKVNGHDCTVLEIGVDGRTDQWMIEDQTGHILRIVSSADAEDDEYVDYDDFRTAGPLTVPFRETTYQKGKLHAVEQTRQYNLDRVFPREVFRTPLASAWYRKVDKKNKE
jgi:hypothetical protein